MHGRHAILPAIMIATIVFSTSSTVRADGLVRYKLVEMGQARASVDLPYGESGGGLSFSPPRSAGDYRIGTIKSTSDPSRSITTYEYSGSGRSNLLPSSLQSPLIILTGLNASGEVVGYGGPLPSFYYNPQSGELFTLKSLPDASQQYIPLAYSINNLHQMVGGIGGQALYYESPAAEPILLNTLVENLGSWNLTLASGINDRGEIYGVGFIQNGDTRSSHYFKLTPTPVPELPGIACFGLTFSLLVVKRKVRWTIM